jgi:hypothetical protein
MGTAPRRLKYSSFEFPTNASELRREFVLPDLATEPRHHPAVPRVDERILAVLRDHRTERYDLSFNSERFFLPEADSLVFLVVRANAALIVPEAALSSCSQPILRRLSSSPVLPLL